MKKHFIHLFSTLLLALVLISVPTLDTFIDLKSKFGTCVDLEEDIIRD